MPETVMPTPQKTGTKDTDTCHDLQHTGSRQPTEDIKQVIRLGQRDRETNDSTTSPD